MFIRHPAMVLITGALLAACQQQPADIGNLVPVKEKARVNENYVIAARLVKNAEESFDQDYTVRWTCAWDDKPSSWSLPGIRVEEGEAYSFNDWTRLKGAVVPAKVIKEGVEGEPLQLKLIGKRKSEDGAWYEMELVGPVYRDRPSMLRGYWKGAICTAELKPATRAASRTDTDA